MTDSQSPSSFPCISKEGGNCTIHNCHGVHGMTCQHSYDAYYIWEEGKAKDLPVRFPLTCPRKQGRSSSMEPAVRARMKAWVCLWVGGSVCVHVENVQCMIGLHNLCQCYKSSNLFLHPRIDALVPKQT